jgi:hypothetical protein
MLGRRGRRQPELLVAGSLRDVLPADHVLVRVCVLDLGWLHGEVDGLYHRVDGRPSIEMCPDGRFAGRMSNCSGTPLQGTTLH